MIPTQEVDVAVIGGGPAGMAAAVAAREKGAENVVLIEREARLGGVLNQCIHDGFGTKVFKEALTGPEYAGIYADRVHDSGVQTWLGTTVMDLKKDRSLVAISAEGMRRVQAGAVVLSMGCRERPRGAIGIPGTRPAGVFTAGAVQTYMNLRNLAVGKRVVILGSGDIGLIMARRLTLEGAKVLAVAEIMPYPSGLARNIVQCLEDFNIPLHLRTTVVEIHGTQRLTGVTLAEVGTRGGIKPGTKRFIECDTLLLSVGLVPENELTQRAGIPLSRVTNGPVVDDSFQTETPGIFACGNVLQVHDVVDYATLEAEKAGAAAAKFVSEGTTPEAKIPVVAGDGLRYVLPARISGIEAVDFTMRVVKPAGESFILFKSGDDLVRRIRQPALVPAEMVRVRLNKGRFSSLSSLVVEVGS